MPEREGQRLGNYRLHRLLGKGSFAEVYLGEHLYLKTSVAIKVLHTALNEQDEQLFLTEAQTVAQLVHPNIVRVHEFAIEHATPFLVMDYAPGGTLRQRYRAGVCLSLEQVVLYVKQIAAALQYAHNKGIIHRDIKAENILQGPQQVILSDFGISVQAPRSGGMTSQEWAGTLAYMAPEQFQGQAVFASDQYALAVLAYEWLCGHRPFEGSSLMLAYQHREVAPPRLLAQDPSLPEAIETVILKALSKKPGERYVSVINFARALERACNTIGAEPQTQINTARLESSSQSRSRRIFISHAAQDDVTRLHSDLSTHDIQVQRSATVEPQEVQTRRAIRASQIVCLVLTPHTRSSTVVQQHLRIATLYGRTILCLWAQGDALNQLLPPEAEHATILDARGPRYRETLEDIFSFLEHEQHGVTTSATPQPLPFLDDEPRNPYKGLRAFTRQDQADFFGRTAVVEEILAQLRKTMPTTPELDTPRPRFLAVVGPSGSGKSSVVMAGLLPRLQENALPGSERWIYLDPLVPGKQPLEALAQTLTASFPGRSLQAVRDVLERDDCQGLHKLGLALVRHPETRVVVTIDQFEELFSAQISESERKQCIQLLVTAASEAQGTVLVLLTLRADFYDRPFAYPALGRLIQSQQCAVLPMSINDLREVVERPASLPDVALTFDEDLVNDLLSDLRGQVGALPLLEFALDQLFQHRRERRLTRFAYQEMGGVRGALAKHAEATYAALPDDEHRRFAQTLFLRLVQPTTQEREPVRRHADTSEFVSEQAQQTDMLRTVSDAFVAARLITINQSITSSTLEVSHEALIREWPRLTTWLQEARADMQLQQAISKDMSLWEQRGKPKDRLYHGSQLKESLAWQQRNIASGNEAAFLRTSLAHNTRRRISILLAVAMLFLLLIPTSIFLVQQFLPLTVTTLQDDIPGSLRQVITAARAGSTITINTNLKGTMTLNKTLIIGKDLTLRGPGVNQLAIRGKRDQNALVFVLPHTNVTLSRIKFSDPSPASGPVIQNAGTLILDQCSFTGNTNLNPEKTAGSPAYGGAIRNYGGNLTLQYSSIAQNTVIAENGFGGGISNDGGGSLTIRNSQIVDNKVISHGQIAHGGGIFSAVSKLMLINSTIARNVIIGGQDTALVGGGIQSAKDTLSLINSTVSDNRVEGGSTNAGVSGGGIVSDESTVLIRQSRVSGNVLIGKNEALGGGLAAGGSTITIEQSTISNNSAKGNGGMWGGGIYSSDVPININDPATYKGTLAITDSSISNNSVSTSSTDKDGVYGGGISAERTALTLNRTTVALNTISNSNNKGEAAGGGLFVNSKEDGTTKLSMNLTNCTIADNKVQGGPNSHGGGLNIKMQNGSIDFCTIYGNNALQGGGIKTEITQLLDFTLKNSIIAGNPATTDPDISGTITTGGYNLVQHTFGDRLNDPMNKHKTDITVNNLPDLGIAAQLKTNGGPTPTLALQSGSPAMNVIPAASCDTPTDQRGIKRPQQGICDIGAYEYN